MNPGNRSLLIVEDVSVVDKEVNVWMKFHPVIENIILLENFHFPK
jgi:hypothetical protein